VRKIKRIKKLIRFLAGVAVGFGAAELLKREKQRRADARSWSEFSKRIDLNQY
jgi:hypothetical protein